VRTVLVVAVLLSIVVVAALLASPRHRAMYFGGQMPVPSSLQPRELVRRMAGRAPTAAVIARGRDVQGADAEGLKIPMSDDPGRRVPSDGVPSGWEVREFAGRADVELVRGERGLALHLRSARTSFAVYRDLVVDLEEFPTLAWSWKVSRLPAGGDVRDRGRDDQAAQVYVVFPRWPAPRTQSEVIGYVWDTTAPVGTITVSAKASNVKLIVIESGPADLGSWRRAQRNVATDYQTLFGRRAPRVGAVALMIDSNDTRDAADSTIGDLAFLRFRAAERVKTPTSMLR
jgi:hypothetical protein